jgi:hypothetical protein
MMSDAVAGLIGGVIGGSLGVLGTTVSAYYGPRQLEQWRQDRHDKPREQLLKRMLEDNRFPDGRSLERLMIVTGTEPDECRRLLIQVGARGVIFQGGKEGWALIERKPLDGEFSSDASPDA